jgi:hypothetical protein
VELDRGLHTSATYTVRQAADDWLSDDQPPPGSDTQSPEPEPGARTRTGTHPGASVVETEVSRRAALGRGPSGDDRAWILVLPEDVEPVAEPVHLIAITAAHRI